MKSTELANAVEIVDALESEDNEVLAAAINNKISKEIENSVMAKYEELKDITDEKILASRGIYMPTQEEKKFLDKLNTMYNEVGMSPTTGGSLIIPKTLIDRVFEDMISDEDSILGEIDFVNSTGATEWLVSVAEKPVAAWGELCDPITKELSVGFKVKNAIDNKLSCYLPYCLSLLELGYQWQEAYIREYMAKGLSIALTTAFISGDGAKKPVGMAYNYNWETDTATAKTAVKVSEISRKGFAPIFKTISTNPLGFRRTLNGLTLFVDADTYYTYVFPNDEIVNANGRFVSMWENLGVKVRVVETGLEAGKAVIGLAKRYAGQIAYGSNNRGNITYSDEFLFLEDKRVYKAKLYADGLPKDDNAFVLLDLTDLAGE